MSNKERNVARLLYKEIVEGDRRKAKAESNDSASGGGARDFRFPYQEVLPIVTKLFPTTVLRGEKVVHQGTLFWKEPGAMQTVSRAVEFMSPTKSRPREGWISQVTKFSCFDIDRMPPAGPGNRILLLLIQLYDDTVWPFFAEERTLRTKGAWNPLVAQELLDCLDAKRASNRAVIGYRDFTNEDRFCNGH